MYRLLFIVLLFVPSSLFAFNRAQTCLSFEEREARGSAAPSGAPQCKGDDSGKLFQWGSNNPSYFFNNVAIDQFSGEEDRKAFLDEIRLSFEAWNDVDCSSFAFEPVYTSFTVLGHRLDEESWLSFYETEDWPHSSQVVALTTISTLPSGIIVDADIEVNSKGNELTINGDPLKFDVRNFLTHETGHFLGLDHSGVFDATMQYQTIEGRIGKRDLHADDEAGICDIYPLDFEPVIIDNSEGCCSTTRGAPNPIGWLLFSCLFLISIRRLKP